MKEHESMEFGGLKFFGKMTAGVSHEIKNCLAIIGEQSGLMEDLMLMAQQGIPLDLQRFKKLSEGIARQVTRADEIVRRLNRFAHSVDELYSSVDLNETLRLVLALNHRFAASKALELKAELPDRPVEVSTSPFLLEEIVFLCLDSIMAKVRGGGTLVVSSEDTGDSVKVFFSTHESISLSNDDLPQDTLPSLLNRLGADVKVGADAGDKTLVLRLPKQVSRI